jgi:hypothetical protein
MKTQSRKELVALSIAIFKVRTEKVLFATSDGQFFVLKDRAHTHANSQEKKLTVYEIERTEVEDQLSEKTTTPSKEDEGYTVKELEALVAESSDPKALEGFLQDEKSGKNRKTAIAAIQERIDELAKASEASISETKTKE